MQTESDSAADGIRITVCGIDPGLVNMSVWVGSYFPETHKVSTVLLRKCACGGSMVSSEDPFLPKKQSVQASSADSAIEIADICLSRKVEAVVVETAPTWNVPIRISAATMYGVLRGKGVPGVKFSSASTKASAIELLADRLGVHLEEHPAGVDKRDKKASAKIRLINKRNAVAVVERLLERSKDEVGSKAFESDPKKRDDMADAILLGCGTALGVQKQREKDARKSRAARNKVNKK
jgi:hypothetical protein